MIVSSRRHRVAGAIIGSAVGDALGAPFEFGSPNMLAERFPVPARGTKTEMCGGGSFNWAPGEFTDDTQMGLVLAFSLLDAGTLDEEKIFAGFKQWFNAGPADVGVSTADVLRSDKGWDTAAKHSFEWNNRGAGNGALMRATPSAVFFARQGQIVSMDAGRRIAALTHGDPSNWEGVAIYHELMRVALEGVDPLSVIDDVLSLVEFDQERWSGLLSPSWSPDQATESNGAVWPTLASAVWALRNSSSFEEAIRLVINLGGDTDTVAAVTGGLAGAVYGVDNIPVRWASAVNGVVPGFGSDVWRRDDLLQLAYMLDGGSANIFVPNVSEGIVPLEVFPGVWAADLDGAKVSDHHFAVFSLCRVEERFGHPLQRFAFLMDDASNPNVDFVLADVIADMVALHKEGVPILVHCHHGASRTGLVLRAWARQTLGYSPVVATQKVLELWPHLGLWEPSFDGALERFNP